MPILVFESTGAQVYGMIASRNLRSPVKYSRIVRSANVDLERALGEVLQQLEIDHKGKIPSKAVVVTPAVFTDLVHLPVNPKEPKKAPQMRELVRWELEEVAHSTELWSVGSLLQAKGYVSALDRHKIEGQAALERTFSEANGQFRELVGTDRFEECLTLVESLSHTNNDLAVAWKALPDAEAVEGRFPWYAAGVDTAVCEKWVQALELHGIFCESLYPQLGAGSSLVTIKHNEFSKSASKYAAKLKEEEFAFVDVRQDQAALFQGTAQSLTETKVIKIPYGRLVPCELAEDIIQSLTPEVQQLYLSAKFDDAEEIRRELNELANNLEVNFIELEAFTEKLEDLIPTCPFPNLVSMVAVAEQALKARVSNKLLEVKAQRAKPALWKKEGFGAWATLVILFVLIVLNQVYIQLETAKKSQELEDFEIEKATKTKLASTIQSERTKVQAIEKTLAIKQAELEHLENFEFVLNSLIRTRQILVPGVLKDIAKVISEGLFLDVIEEDKDRDGFYLEGWAFSNTEAQKFGKNLTDSLEKWAYKVSDLEIRRGENRHGDLGYIFKVRLQSIVELDEGFPVESSKKKEMKNAQ